MFKDLCVPSSKCILSQVFENSRVSLPVSGYIMQQHLAKYDQHNSKLNETMFCLIYLMPFTTTIHRYTSTIGLYYSVQAHRNVQCIRMHDAHHLFLIHTKIRCSIKYQANGLIYEENCHQQSFGCSAYPHNSQLYPHTRVLVFIIFTIAYTEVNVLNISD